MATSTDRPLEDYEIARPLADQFRVSFRLDAAPKTLAEWADVTARALRGGDFCGKFDEYCRGGSTPHGVSAGDRVARFRGLFIPFWLQSPTVAANGSPYAPAVPFPGVPSAGG